MLINFQGLVAKYKVLAPWGPLSISAEEEIVFCKKTKFLLESQTVLKILNLSLKSSSIHAPF